MGIDMHCIVVPTLCKFKQGSSIIQNSRLKEVTSLATSVHDLGVTLDSELTFADHIYLLTRCCFYQLRRLRAIRRLVSPKVFLTIVHAFICTRIDYCNSLLIGLPETRLAPVLSVLNAAARMIARLPPYSHISDCMINELHWRPILARVRYMYRVLLLVAKSQQGLAPKYLCELMSKPPSARPLVSCALLIILIFLYLGPVLLYPRIGPLLWWVLHYGMTLLLHLGV